MTFFDIVKMAATNLWRRKARTFLTVLGVIIGTACIVVMVALGLGNLEQFEQSVMQSSSLTQIEVYDYSGGMGQSSRINDALIDQFKQMEGVKNATPVLEIPAYLKSGKYVADMYLYCVDPAAMDFTLAEGSVFDASSSTPELVMGSNTLYNFMDSTQKDSMNYGMMYSSDGSVTYIDEYGNEIEMTGPDIDWLNETFIYYPANSWLLEDTSGEYPAPKQYKAHITGLLEQSDSEQSYAAYMSLEAGNKIIRDNRELMREMYGIEPGEYTRAYVYVNSIDDAATVLQQIKDMGLEAYSPTEWITQMQDEQQRQQSQLMAIGLIALLVSAIGIANTMLASILERRREIGVMKVIGLSVHKINVMFLVESAMIGLLGGVIGLALSFVFTRVATGMGGDASILGMYFSDGVTFSIPLWLALGAIGIAVGTGVLSGIYPAWRATRLSPLEAIRSVE